MSEHPFVACYRGLDNADAVGFGALLAAALDEPLVLASAYEEAKHRCRCRLHALVGSWWITPWFPCADLDD